MTRLYGLYLFSVFDQQLVLLWIFVERVTKHPILKGVDAANHILRQSDENGI